MPWALSWPWLGVVVTDAVSEVLAVAVGCCLRPCRGCRLSRCRGRLSWLWSRRLRRLLWPWESDTVSKVLDVAMGAVLAVAVGAVLAVAVGGCLGCVRGGCCC